MSSEGAWWIEYRAQPFRGLLFRFVDEVRAMRPFAAPAILVTSPTKAKSTVDRARGVLSFAWLVQDHADKGQRDAGRGPLPLEPPGYDDRVAVTAQTKLDAGKLRADFPIFEQEIRGKPLAYLDSAVSSHKPRQVLDKLRNFYETSYANVHRGVYTLSEVATAEYEGAREKVARFVNAPEARELIFTHGATESINLVAYAWGLDNLGPGDVVARHRARAPLELRSVAVHRQAHGRDLHRDPARRSRRAQARRAR